MAFNKNKALESALKLLNQGKVAQAIGEYQQILRHDGKDQATLMTVGDLFARQGDMTQAIDYFQRLAQVYLTDGFNSKAIAIYKKIAKLAPAELAPLEKLADLYVQQGVLSEARPLFLQIAEAHLKANRAPKAVEVLHRLLDVEPDNPRVQMRLAELYNVMGQKKEAGQTYFAYAQRLYERNESEEAQKLIERALEADSSNLPALLLKAKIFMLAQKSKEAIAILESHAEADGGGEVTNLLIDLLLKSDQIEKAADRARNQLARGSAHFVMLHRVADSLIDGGKAAEALPLLRELRDPMIEQGEQDKFLNTLSSATEKLPGETEPLEMLADFCRHTGDPFPLNAALSQLADAYAAAGNYSRAEEMLQEMIERNKADERLFARLDQLRARASGIIAPPTERKAQTPVPEDAAVETAPEVLFPIVEESPIDEETQRYISQALTDVDLFSSYGLTQKATVLLENVLKRAPFHTPTLERLLDLYLGAGNERRTSELAAQLEQIHRERQDTTAADRFAELRLNFQKAADLTGEASEPVAFAPKAPTTMGGRRSVENASMGAVPVDDAQEQSETSATPEPSRAEFSIVPVPAERAPVPFEMPSEDASIELDLSDEWEAMIQEAVEPVPHAAQENPGAETSLASAELETPHVVDVPAPEFQVSGEVIELNADFEAEAHGEVEAVADGLGVEQRFEIVDDTPEAVVAGNDELDFELSPEPVETEIKAGAATTEDFLNELAAEIDGLEVPVDPAVQIGAPVNGNAATPIAASPEVTAESLNELSEVFQEFRNELGELGEEDEDLETHYNLGIAYREMGLLDEAIGEFQKVAKAVQKGKPFRYAMNCSTLLALSFMDKGEPMIASLWYRRALDIPGLELETIIALRYDLAVSLEMAGEAASALDSFRQVYAMNIDYRDVADHIATLQKV